jgi:hypothetical protein
MNIIKQIIENNENNRTIAALKVFSRLGQLIEDDEKLNNKPYLSS